MTKQSSKSALPTETIDYHGGVLLIDTPDGWRVAFLTGATIARLEVGLVTGTFPHYLSACLAVAEIMARMEELAEEMEGEKRGTNGTAT